VIDYHDLDAQQRLAFRKKKEIRRKLRALKTEFNSWLSRSSTAESPLAKHHSQLRAIRSFLRPWSKTVCTLIKEDSAANSDEFLASVSNAQRLILSEHRIWEYFRAKFVQRSEPSFKDYLAVADEFAWSCYRPVLEVVYAESDMKRREPPLVFFNGGSSPFSLSREKKFQPEIVADEPLSKKAIELSKLPIPVVGIPWNQVNHLPDAVVIGHEVGHIVEDDFGLTENLQRLLQEAITEAGAESRKGAWDKWLGEIFADIYGCLATGPGFAGGLIDFLARAPEDVSLEKKVSKNWGNYPTVYLRGRLVLETLSQLGFSQEIESYEKIWKDFKSQMNKGYEKDIPHIVDKLLNGKSIKSHDAPAANKSIAEILSFTKENYNDGKDILSRLQQDLGAFGGNIRALIAGIRYAFEDDPTEFLRRDYGRTMVTYINTEVVTPGLRDGELPLTDKQVAEKTRIYESQAKEIINDLLN
jgi:hypothetical protein